MRVRVGLHRRDCSKLVDASHKQADLLAATPLPFSTLHTSSDIVDVDGVPVRVASVDHLVAMKGLSGRAQDLADIEALSQLTGRPMVDRDEHDEG